jgi:magnesium-transporting ATPase (P-type)
MRDQTINLFSEFLVPANFQEILTSFTKQGFRVIACARKSLDISLVKIERTERYF